MRNTMRIITVCSSGGKAKSITRNPNRIKLLHNVMHAIILRSNWTDIDAIVFSGGYFYHNQFLGHLPFAERKDHLEQASFTRDIRLLAYMLHQYGSPDAKVVCGIDTKHRSDWENGDEFCVAYDMEGIIGISR